MKEYYEHSEIPGHLLKYFEAIEAPTEPCIVLDPFCGSGTTVMVALRLGRRAIGIELSEAYVKMARRRIIDDCPMLNIPGEEEPCEQSRG